MQTILPDANRCSQYAHSVGTWILGIRRIEALALAREAADVSHVPVRFVQPEYRYHPILQHRCSSEEVRYRIL